MKEYLVNGIHDFDSMIVIEFNGRRYKNKTEFYLKDARPIYIGNKNAFMVPTLLKIAHSDTLIYLDKELIKNMFR